MRVKLEDDDKNTTRKKWIKCPNDKHRSPYRYREVIKYFNERRIASLKCTKTSVVEICKAGIIKPDVVCHILWVYSPVHSSWLLHNFYFDLHIEQEWWQPEILNKMRDSWGDGWWNWNISLVPTLLYALASLKILTLMKNRERERDIDRCFAKG